MDRLEAKEILRRNIEKDEKHRDYKHVVDLAKNYKQLITGKDIGEKLKRFNPREQKVLFEQRKNLTIAITPAICHSIMNAFWKVPRTTPLVAKFEKKKEINDERVIEEMQAAFDNFYGSDTTVSGLDFFMQNRHAELSFLDPNSWIVIEFDAFDSTKEKAKPRPFEVSAEQAVNFEIKNNRTVWLRVQQKIWMPTKEQGKEQEAVKETIYTDDWAVVFEQTLSNQKEVVLQPGQEWIELASKYYIISYYEMKAGKLPAYRVGYKRDLETDGRTFVSPLHPAMCYLEKCVKQVSEYDLTNCLHVFPQKTVRLVKSCPGVPEDVGGTCRNGKLTDGSTCPTCNGSGKSIHTSAQDVIEVELPENIKEDGFLPLSELVHYVQLPIELLKYQAECIEKFTPLCHQAVFNSTVLVQKQYQQQDTEKTATQVDSDMESVYDTLSPFGDKYSAVWMQNVEFIAIFTDNDQKITWLHRFPTNFKLKTRQHLYSEYKTASEGAMPSFVIDSITDELAENVFMDDADSLLKYRVKKIHFPFRGKTKEEIMLLLSSEDVLRETKVLYNYFDDIFQQLENDTAKNKNDFYLLPLEERKTMITMKVDEIIKKLKEAQPAAFSFTKPMAGSEAA